VTAQRRRRITRTAAAIGVVTGAYAVSFGVLSVAAGLSPQTLNGGQRLALDARAAALAVAAVLVWRRAPFLLVVLAAASTAALLRLL
jgi:hypothetical protein